MTESIATLGIKVGTKGIKEAERDLKGLAEQGEKTERRAVELGKAWGVALGGAIVAGAGLVAVGMRKYVANTIEAERVQAQLTARIKSTGAAAGLTVGELNKMADALQAATTFDDEAINGAQGLLLTFTRIGKDVFPRATEAVLDMSTALGGDLNSAAMQVGKALNDPVQGITALSRAGVQFSETQKDTIKQLVETNRVAEAQKIILKELETQMGGSARAARDTLGGALQALGNSFDNLLEGDAGSGGMRGAREAVESFNRALNDPGIKRGVDSAASGMITIANAAVQLIAQLGNAGSALREFFASNENKGRASLQNLLNDKESQLFAIERQNRGSLSFLRRDTTPLKAEIAELERLIDLRDREARAAGRAGVQVLGRTSKPGKGIWANINQPAGSVELADPKATARVRERTSATRELSEAEKALQDILEVNALIDAEVDGFRRNRIEQDYQAAVAADERRAQNEGYLQSLRDELALMGMAGVQREIEIAQRYLSADATKAQRSALTDLVTEMNAAREMTGFIDEFRRTSADALRDFAKGAISAKDAIASLFDTMADRITQMIAERWIEKLFGSQGSTGAGTKGGDILGGVFNAIFGGGWGGFATGGYTGAGNKYEPAGIVHRGEYVINADATRRLGRGYLDRLNSGQGQAMAGGSVSNNLTQTFIVQGTPDGRTREQMARASGREAARGLARTGR